MKKNNPKLSHLAAGMLELMQLGQKKYPGRTVVVLITNPEDKRGVLRIPFGVLAFVHFTARPDVPDYQFQALLEALNCILKCEISKPQLLAIAKLRDNLLINAAIAQGTSLHVFPGGEIETVKDGRPFLLGPNPDTWTEHELPE